MLAKLIKNRFFWPILLLVLIVPTFTFLLKPGLYWNMHDDMQMIRQLEIEKCLYDGQIPCRWTPDLGYSYGYPLFNFYPPLPYIVGQAFRLLGFSFISTVKLTSIVLIISSAFAMYLLASSLTSNLGGLAAALFYTYAPYHAVNIYVRGAMNEAWASLFFPLIFYFSQKYLKKPSTSSLLFLSLSWSGLLLSHNPMAMTFVLFFAPWCLYWYLKNYHRPYSLKPVLNLVLSGVFALSLAAFFTLPVLFESKLVQIETMFQNYYHYSVHFISFVQLFFNNFWGDGPSVWGVYDGMSFGIGFFHYAVPLLIALFYIYQLIRNRDYKKSLLPLIIIFLAFFATFMAHERSSFLWLILSPIQKIQFPWRFLNHSLFLFSLSIAFLPIVLKTIFPKIRLIIVSIILFFLVALNYKFFFPVTFGPITDEQKFSGLAWNNQITSGIYDYLPKTASTAAKTKAQEIVDVVDPSDTEYVLQNYQKGTDWWLFNLKNESFASFTLSSLYFPNFEITDNLVPISYDVEPELGRIVIKLDPGQHQIYLKFTDTPIRKFGNNLSLLAWILTIVYFSRQIWKRKK
ncbi:glycosyltransferase family 39 protein [Patescibacteria group bacterium]|nr:glycosyltransferase family 39 protein [Patescibacteria group bacterium]